VRSMRIRVHGRDSRTIREHGKIMLKGGENIAVAGGLSARKSGMVSDN
jgi:hypothetical protein